MVDDVSYFLPKESFAVKENELCGLKIMTHDILNYWILGLNFFENYYIVFDQEDMKLGFAPSIHA